MTDTAQETRKPVDTVPATVNIKLAHADYSSDYPVFARAHLSPGFDAFLVFDPVHNTVVPVTANVDDAGNPIPTGPTTAIAPPIPGIDPAAQAMVQNMIQDAIRQAFAAGVTAAASGAVAAPAPPAAPPAAPAPPALVDQTTGENVAAPADLGFPATAPATGVDVTPSGTLVEAPSVNG